MYGSRLATRKTKIGKVGLFNDHDSRYRLSYRGRPFVCGIRAADHRIFYAMSIGQAALDLAHLAPLGF